jgi:type I restriction enzyme M protein
VEHRSKDNNVDLDFEEKLWRMADKLRNNMDASMYKHVVLGLLFLKYISDAFEERHGQLLIEQSHGADPEDKDEYLGYNIFWVPKESRWTKLQESSRQPSIGKMIDTAMAGIENENPSLKGVLPKDYSRQDLDKQRLGQLIDLISNIGLGNSLNRSKDLLGRVYEYFLSQFASAEGKKGGQFYTPRSIVKLLVDMIEPFYGRIYDPCCGSGGMLVQSEKFVEIHGGDKGAISIYGQESNPTTWRLCKMNLAIRGIEGNIGEYSADSFRNDLHKDLKADFIIANPPFNDSDWNGETMRDDHRWKYGVPPPSNANFAWVQHFIYHLSSNGIAGFVLANGSLSSNISNEGEIRKAIVKSDLVDCIIALPDKLFYSTGISACLWFIANNKENSNFRVRNGEILVINAQKMGTMIDRTHRSLTDEEIKRISQTYQNWRSKDGYSLYNDVNGFCKSLTIEDISNENYVLSPSRYIAYEEPNHNESVDKDLEVLSRNLSELFTRSQLLEKKIQKSLRDLKIVE